MIVHRRWRGVACRSRCHWFCADELRQMGFVVRSSEIPAWAATADGQRAIEKARANAE